VLSKICKRKGSSGWADGVPASSTSIRDVRRNRLTPIDIEALACAGRTRMVNGHAQENPAERGRFDGPDLSRTLAEQLSCSMLLLGLLPMHSDSQQFARVAGWFETGATRRSIRCVIS